MLQGIEGESVCLIISQHGHGIASENTKGYFTCRTDDLAIVVFNCGSHVEAPGATKSNPVLKQNIPGHQVVGGIEASLVGGYTRYFLDRAEKIIHQVQLVRGQVVKETTTGYSRVYPPPDLRIRQFFLGKRRFG